jgi:hypothetical protein
MKETRTPYPVEITSSSSAIAVVVGIGQLPYVRDAGEKDRALVGEHRKSDAIERLFEPIGKERPVIGNSVAILVLEADDAIGDPAEPSLRKAGCVFFIHLEPVFDRDCLEVVANQFVGTAKIGDAQPETIGFCHKESSFRIESETAWILDKGKRDPGVTLESLVLDQSSKGSLLVGELGNFRFGNGWQWLETALQFFRGDRRSVRRSKKNEEGKK